jgi:hypothetical protein
MIMARLLFVITLLTAVMGTGVWAEGLSGYAEAKGAGYLEKSEDPSFVGWAVLTAKYEKKLGDVQFTGGFRGETASWDDERGRCDFDPADHDVRRSSLSVQDFWVRIPLTPALDLQAGHFQLGWGKTDGYSPADAFLPRDLTDPFADEKILLWAVRLTGQTGNVRFEAVNTPVTTPWRLPVLGRRNAPFRGTGLPDNTEYLERENDPPDSGFTALRVLATLDQWDVGAWGRAGIRPAPLLRFRTDQVSFTPEGNPVLPIERRYVREKAAGIEVSRTMASWVLRGEAAVLSSDNDELGDAVIGVVSAEKGFGDGTLLVTVAQNFKDTPVDASLLFDRAILPAVITAWHKTEEWGEWKLVFTESLEQWDGLLTAESGYNLTDYWKITLGADIPYGSRNTYFGNLYEARRIRMALRRSW